MFARLDDLFNVVVAQFDRIDRRIELAQEALGRIEMRQLEGNSSNRLSDYEFRTFSQWGEDGIIQFLLHRIKIDRKVFVEFGADNYNLESNTRFLLTNNNWAGLVMDSSDQTIKALKSTAAYWLYNLKAVRAFISRDNINELLKENGITGEIGVLSIDIDGNDYWIWEAIDVVQPIIVIVEYNHRFGPDRAVTIPYDENFDRVKAHPSRIYYGASLRALCDLGDEKGYAFVGCNSNGLNAFFVRRDKKPDAIRELTASEGYVAGAFSEVQREGDMLVKWSHADESALLDSSELPLVAVGSDSRGKKSG